MARVHATVHKVTAALIVVIAVVVRVIVVRPERESTVPRVKAMMMVEVVAMAEMSATHKRTARTDCNRATWRDRCRAEAGPSTDTRAAREGTSPNNRPATKDAGAHWRGSKPTADSAAAEPATSGTEAAVTEASTSTAKAAMSATKAAASAGSAGRRDIGRKQDYRRRCKQREDHSA